LKIKNGLSKLVKKLEEIAPLKWIRLMYLYPAGIDNQLIETIAASEKIVHYIDMPVQHINNKILKSMRRPDTRQRICRLIENLRSTIPDIVLRTTIMVGFPGETDQQFNELLEFINWAKFDALGCFRFYPESGTPAAEMPDQVPDQIKQQRLEQLMLIQQNIAFAKNKSRIGSELTCLVDSVDNKGTGLAPAPPPTSSCRRQEWGGSGQGRFYGQAPDIDSICIIKDCSGKPGQFINTKVVDTRDYDLLVEPVRSKSHKTNENFRAKTLTSNGVEQI
jgi:ribosomal protein S12 methylthiotransferase